MPQFGHLGDDGIYWTSAKSLSDGQGYRIASLPTQPHQTKYPPLYSLLLTLIWRINPQFPANLQIAAVLAWLMLPAMLIAALVYYRGLELSWTFTGILCGLLALNLQLIYFSLSIMPELLFMALLLACVGLADRARGVRGAAVAGLLGAAAYLTKSAGLPLLACSPILFLSRKQYKHAAAFFLAMFPFVAGWMLWSRVHIVNGADPVVMFYTDYFAYQVYNVSWNEYPALIWRNLGALLFGIGELLGLPGTESKPVSLALQTVALVAIAFVVRAAVRSRVSHYHAFALGVLPMLLAWHYPPTARFSLPLLPLLLLGIGSELKRKCGVTFFGNSKSRPRALIAMIPVVACVGVPLAALYVDQVRGLLNWTTETRRQLQAARGAYAWIAQNLPHPTPVLTELDSLFWLYTGQPATMLPVPPGLLYREGVRGVARWHAAVAEQAAQRGIQYMYVSPWEYSFSYFPEATRRMMASILADGATFLPVHRSTGGTVYRILTANPRAPAPDLTAAPGVASKMPPINR